MSQYTSRHASSPAFAGVDVDKLAELILARWKHEKAASQGEQDIAMLEEYIRDQQKRRTAGLVSKNGTSNGSHNGSHNGGHNGSSTNASTSSSSSSSTTNTGVNSQKMATDSAAYQTLLDECARHGRYEMALDLLWGMQVSTLPVPPSFASAGRRLPFRPSPFQPSSCKRALLPLTRMPATIFPSLLLCVPACVPPVPPPSLRAPCPGAANRPMMAW